MIDVLSDGNAPRCSVDPQRKILGSVVSRVQYGMSGPYVVYRRQRDVMDFVFLPAGYLQEGHC